MVTRPKKFTDGNFSLHFLRALPNPVYLGKRGTIPNKIACCILMVLASGILLWFINSALFYLPDLADISTFNPSHYQTSCGKQRFLLKPNGNSWMLESIRQYSAEDVLLFERIYQYDSSGQAYYVTQDGNRQDISNLSWEQNRSLLNYHFSDDILREEFDAAGRLTYRESKNKNEPLETDTVQWYYIGNASAANELCTLVETTHIVDADGKTYQFFDADWNAISELTKYTIYSFDRYGNILDLCIQTDAYFQTDRNGYLQMIVLEWYGGYEVIRVDTSGKPLWSANYSRENQELLSYTVWNYIQS